MVLFVYLLQFILNQYGYNLSVDGIFGTRTLNAVRDFQRNNSLSVDLEKYKAVAESDESEFLAEYFLPPDDDGTLYQCITTTFYRHSTLLDQDKVENPVFTSTKTLDLKSKHGFTLFVSMSTEGLLWSTDYPFFDAIPEEE